MEIMNTETTDQTIEDLINSYRIDILCDCHSLRARIGRSSARRELQKMGQLTLKPIKEYLKKTFPAGKEVNSDLFTAFVSLLFDIIADSNLPSPPCPPFSPETEDKNKEINKWIDYCEANG